MNVGTGMTPPEPLPNSAALTSARPQPQQTPTGSNNSVGLVRVVTPDENERLRQQAASHTNLPELMPELTSYIRQQWEVNKKAKQQIEEEMIEALRMRKGEYSPDKLQKIQQAGGSEAFFNLPETKCRAAKAWIEDILLQPGQKPFGIKPSPSPELSPIETARLQDRIREEAITQAVMQEQETGKPVDINVLKQHIDAAMTYATAKLSDAEFKQASATAEKMETTINDKLTEAKFTKHFRDFIDDVVGFHCGVMKGPFGINRTKLKWSRSQQGFVPAVGSEVSTGLKRVNPLNLYPSPDSTGVNDGNLIERTRYSRRDLQNMKGVPGYRSDAIDAVLYEHRNGGLREWLWTDHELDRVRNISQLSSYDTSKIDGLECYLSVPGSLLADWHIPGVTDLTREYEIIAVLIGRHLVYVTLNPHPLNQRPYSIASMMKNPDGFWGRSIPQAIKHDADSANMLYRSAMNNSAMSAGPLVQEMVNRLAPGERPGEIYPMKVYLTTDDMVGGTQPPVQFFNVPLTAHQLIEVLRFVSAMADEHSGVPAYAHGSEDVGGAGDTASGLSMLMNAAARGIKNVIRNIDEALEDLITRCFVWEMLYNPDQTIKGDLEVKVYGSNELLLKEQMLIRRKELLGQLNNPVDLQVTGIEGRANLLRETLKAADIPVDEVIMGMTTANPVNPNMNMLPAQGQPQQGAAPGQVVMPPVLAQNTDAAGNPAGGTDNSLQPKGKGMQAA